MSRKDGSTEVLDSNARRRSMIRMRLAGKTLQEIGDLYGITRERVRQITGGAVVMTTVRRRIDARVSEDIRNEAKAFRAMGHWWGHVEKLGNENGCWIWRGSKSGGGYGHFKSPRLFGKVESAHRQSFFLHNGYFPKRPMNVLHKCNNPACVRPDHLYEGTQSENVADAVAANGGIHWTARRKGIQRGSMHPERDQKIRDLRAKGMSIADLVQKFGLCSGRIYAIIKAGP